MAGGVRKGQMLKASEEKHTNHFQVYFTDDEMKKIWEVSDYFDVRQGVLMRKLFNRFYEDFEKMDDIERLKCLKN